MSWGMLAVGAGLVLATIALVFRPLIRARAEPAVAKSLWALVVILPLAVAGVFTQITTYPWGQPVPEPPAPASAEPAVTRQAAIEQMVVGLAARLEREPDDLEGWVLLGRSYMQLQRFSEGVEAWRTAWELSEGNRPDIAISFAEAQVLNDPETLRGGAGELLDALLEDRPNDVRALWYGGLSAAARGQTEVAVQRWARLLESPNLPPDGRQVVQQQLAAIGADVEAFAPAAEQALGGADALQVRIELAAQFADQAQAGQAIFVFARDADQPGGPPVAVKRLPLQEFPLSVALGDRDIMMPGLSLSGVSNLKIVARISQSGQAAAAPGDLYGELNAEQIAAGGETVTLTIDSTVQ